MARRRTSYAADKEALQVRLRKMEGQVRGLQRMIEQERYCLDVVQQITALTAAAREIELMVLGAHLRICVANAVSEQDGEAAIREMLALLRKALR
jgi:DNA-binding FrmR family transcriptional regulator